MSEGKGGPPPVVFIAIGLLFGVAIGIATDNLAFGIGVGVAFGAITGVIMNARNK